MQIHIDLYLNYTIQRHQHQKSQSRLKKYLTIINYKFLKHVNTFRPTSIPKGSNLSLTARRRWFSRAACPGTGPRGVNSRIFWLICGMLGQAGRLPRKTSSASGYVRTGSALVTDRFLRKSKSSRCDCFTLNSGRLNRVFYGWKFRSIIYQKYLVINYGF